MKHDILMKPEMVKKQTGKSNECNFLKKIFNTNRQSAKVRTRYLTSIGIGEFFKKS
jgi:hypothetical protein